MHATMQTRLGTLVLCVASTMLVRHTQDAIGDSLSGLGAETRRIVV